MSRKILLVYDDYAEMIRTQTDLMKVGFDVVGIVNEALLSDQLITFNPELVMTAGRGGKVSAVNVAQRLKENSRFTGKVVILLPVTQRPTTDELAKIRMDSLLELPSPMGKMLQTLARLFKLSAEQLIEKYSKARLAEGASPTEIQAIKSVLNDRASRYERALKGLEIDTKSTTFDRQKVRDRQKELEKDWDPQELEQSDELRRQFAEALFKKS
ncbi:MAG: hypothetical protein KF681_07870 [Bdellovibrionaceae bacterium]|nr:hypothetical protein [Pseudobdellovibrionaceae bacterium]